MRILYLTRAYGEHAGGMERLSFELARELAKQPDTEVSVIPHRGRRITAPLHNLICLPQALQTLRPLSREQKSSPTIILLGDPMLAFAGWLLRKITRKPVAVIVHGLDITYDNPLYQRYLKVFARRFQLYLPISSHTNTLLEQINVSGKRLILSPGTQDRIHQQGVPRTKLADLLGQPTDQIYALATVGRLVSRKGHAWFIRNILPYVGDNIHYVIAGQGPAEQQIKATIKHANLSSRVHLLGRISDEQLAILYNTADAFIYPNIKSKHDVEGFGLVLLEAALSQRPVLASSIDGMPDAIHNGKNGLLLPAEDVSAWTDAITKLAAGTLPLPANPRTYTLAAFNWPQQAARYRAALASLVD